MNISAISCTPEWSHIACCKRWTYRTCSCLGNEAGWPLFARWHNNNNNFNEQCLLSCFCLGFDYAYFILLL